MEIKTCSMCNFEKYQKFYKKYADCKDCKSELGLKRYCEKKIKYQPNE